MKKVILIIGIMLLSIGGNVYAQTYQDYYNLGSSIGSAIRQGVDAKRAREAEERRQEAERQRQEYEYQRQQAERQAEANRQAEIQRQEAARQQAAQAEAQRQEEARRAEAQQQQEVRQFEAKQSENNSTNSQRHILSIDNTATFLSPEGSDIIFKINYDSDEAAFFLTYLNTSGYQRKFISSQVKIKVMYKNDDNEYAYTDACFIKLDRESQKIRLSELFFDISTKKEISDIRISFEGSKIE